METTNTAANLPRFKRIEVEKFAPDSIKTDSEKAERISQK